MELKVPVPPSTWVPPGASARHLAVTLLVHRCLLMVEQSWWHTWSEISGERRRALRAAIAAQAQIPYDVMGPSVYADPPESGVMVWQTACGHKSAEADVRRGLFRSWASGPGYTPWIDVETLRLYDSQADFDRETAYPRERSGAACA